MFRIGVISDTHIPDRANDIPQKILDEFRKVDMVVHAGDLVELGVLDRLKNTCPNIRAVWGNMDNAEVRKKLPEKEIFKILNYKIGVMHGYGSPDRLIELLETIFKNENLSIIIFGHAHHTVNEKRGNTLYFNPGSPTDKVFAPYNSYGIIEIDDKIEAKIIRI